MKKKTNKNENTHIAGHLASGEGGSRHVGLVAGGRVRGGVGGRIVGRVGGAPDYSVHALLTQNYLLKTKQNYLF